MKPSSGKQKARRLQNWCCEMISKITGFEWGYEGQPIRPKVMGESGVDIALSDSARTMFPFSIEARNREKWSIHTWIGDAKKNQVRGTDWMLVVKKNGIKPLVIMDGEAFFKHWGEFIAWLHPEGAEE